VNIWLTHAASARFRVKWRDEDNPLHDLDFDTEAEARAYGERLGGRRLEFRSDLETSLLTASRLRVQNPNLSPEEALALAGFERVRLAPHSETFTPMSGEDLERWSKIAAEGKVARLA
jgi:hypothetical protein